MRKVGSFKATPIDYIDPDLRNLPTEGDLLGYEYDDALKCFGCGQNKYNVLQINRAWYCIECLATLIGTGRFIVSEFDEDSEQVAQADPAEVVINDDGTIQDGDLTVAWE